MKTILYILFLFLIFAEASFSQKREDIQYNNAVDAYNNNDYKTAISIVEVLKRSLKNERPKYLSLEILAKSELIKSDFFADYDLIVETRNLINKYIKNPNSKKDSNYSLVIAENAIVRTYPKDLASFNLQQEAAIRDETLQKEREQNEAIAEKTRLELLALQTKARQENELIAKKERIDREYIKNEQIVLEKEKNRLATIDADKQSAKETEKYNKKKDRQRNNSLNSFSSIGFQGGEIAKYGLIYESGGRTTVGFRFSARTSLTPEQDILNGTINKNKTEAELGPNFKIFNRLYINVGAGYGFYNRIINNDFAGELLLEKTGYTVATAGLMIRISRVVSINGGAAFMDINKDLYKPEITFGISFNLKGKYKN